MRKLTRGLGVCLVAILAVLLFVRWCSSPKPPVPPSPPGFLPATAPPACPGSTWTARAVPDIETTLGGCEPQGCGLNGAWLGQQVKFRELHISPDISNKQGLSITSFTLDNQTLRMEVTGDELSGTGANGRLSGRKLVGSQIRLSSALGAGAAGGPYILTIQDVIEDGLFWTQCNSSDGCANAPKTRLYRFSATDGNGNCIEVCKPGMADEYHTLNGTAVIFKGDLYNDDFTVRSVDGSSSTTQIAPVDSDIFNIACVGTSLSKLYFLHHTSASMDAANKTTVEQRQTLLRLLAGDYCGNGQTFTQDGHKINLDFNRPTLRPNTEVGLASAQSVDAMWKSDGTGASCIGVPRLSDLPNNVPKAWKGSLVDYINSKCNRTFDTCSPNQLDNAR